MLLVLVSYCRNWNFNFNWNAKTIFGRVLGWIYVSTYWNILTRIIRTLPFLPQNFSPVSHSYMQFNSWISNLWFNTITVAYVSFGNSKIADSFFIFPFLIPFCSFSLFELHSTSLTLTSISVCSHFQKAFSILLWTLLYVSSCYDLHIRWLNSTFELLIRWFCSKSLYLSS